MHTFFFRNHFLRHRCFASRLVSFVSLILICGTFTNQAFGQFSVFFYQSTLRAQLLAESSDTGSGIAFWNPLGVGGGGEVGLGSGLSLKLGYQGHFGKSAPILHGPIFDMQYLVFGGRNNLVVSDAYTFSQKYPLAIFASVGPYVRFHDFAEYQTMSERVLSSAVNFGKRGLLTGLHGSLRVEKSLVPSLQTAFSIGYGRAKAPAIQQVAQFQSVEFNLGLSFEL